MDCIMLLVRMSVCLMCYSIEYAVMRGAMFENPHITTRRGQNSKNVRGKRDAIPARRAGKRARIPVGLSRTTSKKQRAEESRLSDRFEGVGV